MNNSNKDNNIRIFSILKITVLSVCILASSFMLTGCSFDSAVVGEIIETVLSATDSNNSSAYQGSSVPGPDSGKPNRSGSSENITSSATADLSVAENSRDTSLPEASGLNSDYKLLASEYDGVNGYVEINGNVPFFTDDDMTTTPYIRLSELDELGRVGSAIMCAGPETITDKPRGDIGDIKPTGWKQHKYPNIVDEQPAMLYNRCHCLMYVMSGLNDEPRNLVTGTRYLNAETMLPFEEGTVDYIERTGNHVIYRVTPIFIDDQLLCQGLLMEAKSVEDKGKYSFNVFCYNVQPGIEINYADGDSWQSKDYTAYLKNDKTDDETFRPDYDVDKDYVLNQGNHKVHTPDCEAVDTMNPKNKASVHDSLKDLVDKGYIICGECN